MANFSDETLERVKDAIDIVDLVGEYLDLKKSGKSYKACCPFHNEKTPSFVVTPGKDIYKCFGCGKSGDGISFIMEMEGLNFPDAVRFLADKYNIPIGNKSPQEAKWEERKRELFKINRDASRFFYKALLTNKAPKRYLQSRGFTSDIVNPFLLGYADPSNNSLYDYLHGKNYKDEDLVHLGLVAPSYTGQGYYDKFRNRLIFPIISRRKVIGFGGRQIGEGQPKYLNSPESDIFHKGSNLYGLNLQKKSRHRDRLILVEGYMDVVSLAMVGIDYAVASLGTSLTEDQAKLIKRSAKEVYISYDGDSAGIQASRRALQIFHDQGVAVKLVLLPGGKDPDDYIKEEGVDAYLDQLDKAMEPLEFEFQLLTTGFDLENEEEKLAFLRKAAPFLAGIQEASFQDLYLGRTAELAGISKESLEKDVVKAKEKLKAEKDKKTSWQGESFRTSWPQSTRQASSTIPTRPGRRGGSTKKRKYFRPWSQKEKKRQEVASTRLWSDRPPKMGIKTSMERERQHLNYEFIRLSFLDLDAYQILAGQKEFLAPSYRSFLQVVEELRAKDIPIQAEWVRKTGLKEEEASLLDQLERDQKSHPLDPDKVCQMAEELKGRVSDFRYREQILKDREDLKLPFDQREPSRTDKEIRDEIDRFETILQKSRGGDYDG